MYKISVCKMWMIIFKINKTNFVHIQSLVNSVSISKPELYITYYLNSFIKECRTIPFFDYLGPDFERNIFSGKMLLTSKSFQFHKSFQIKNTQIIYLRHLTSEVET